MSVPTATILSEGKRIDSSYELMSIDISREVNRIPSATLVFVDGSVAAREFALSNAAVFEPGKEIEIKLRYEGERDTTVFKGLVVRQGVEASHLGSSLSIDLKDKAVSLTSPRHSVVFREVTDAKAIKTIVESAKLGTGTIDSTKSEHPELVQYDATDWDFILSRADINGLTVAVNDGEISVQELDAGGSPKHHFDYGISEMFDFEVEVDAAGQPSAVESVSWDLKQQKPSKAVKAKSLSLAQGNLDGEKLAKAIGYQSTTLSHPAPLEHQEQQAWADARMARSRQAMIRGRISVPGLGTIKLLDVIAIDGIGKRFNGKSVVTGIRHQLGPDGWQTDVQFGLSPKWFCREDEIAAPAAGGLLPPAIHGLQIGVVDKFEEDPDKEFRVRVSLPALHGEKEPVWARLASPDAGKDRGFFFRPETGDEVIVGFCNADPRQPVILGAMFGSKNSPPPSMAKLSDKNLNKGLVTKKGTIIGFLDDDKASAFIETPGKNKIVFDDDAESIQMSDQHGNQITMDQNGIELKSSKDLKISASSGKVEIEGTEVDVK